MGDYWLKSRRDAAEQIVDDGGDQVLALKGEQGALQEEVIACVDQHVSNDFADIPVRRLEEKSEKGRGGWNPGFTSSSAFRILSRGVEVGRD